MRAHVAPSPLLASLLILCASSVPACQRPTAEAPVPPAYTTAATIKDLMLSMIDPAADAVWLSVTTVQTVQGVEETRPGPMQTGQTCGTGRWCSPSRQIC
jgi:hypothetical protein